MSFGIFSENLRIRSATILGNLFWNSLRNLSDNSLLFPFHVEFLQQLFKILLDSFKISYDNSIYKFFTVFPQKFPKQNLMEFSNGIAKEIWKETTGETSRKCLKKCGDFFGNSFTDLRRIPSFGNFGSSSEFFLRISLAMLLRIPSAVFFWFPSLKTAVVIALDITSATLLKKTLFGKIMEPRTETNDNLNGNGQNWSQPSLSSQTR